MNIFHFKNQYDGKQTSQTPGKTAGYKTQVIICWVLLKVLVDKIMLILPEHLQDNGYYLAQSGWLFILFVLLFIKARGFYQSLAMFAAIVYQLTDLFTEVYIMAGVMDLQTGTLPVMGGSLVTMLIITLLIWSKYDSKTSAQ